MLITLNGDSDFQLDQIKTILLPEMTKKNVDVRCLDYGDVQKISGNKVKQELKIKMGIETELAKKLVGEWLDPASVEPDRTASPSRSRTLQTRRPAAARLPRRARALSTRRSQADRA